MSKRKGRSQPRSSEIKSVMRAPTNGEEELEPTSSDADLADEDDSRERVVASEDELEALGFPSDDGEPSPAAAEPEPEQSGISEALPQRRRLRAVRSRETAVTPTPTASDVGTNADDLFDRHAVARWGDDGGAGADADDFLPIEARGEPADDEDAGGQGFATPFPAGAVEGDDTEGFLRGLVEALLFTSQKPLELKELARSAGIDKPRARELVEQLARSYEGRGLCIEQVAGGYVMRSSPRYAPYVQKILALRPVRLSRAQLETLAIVAYRQPVTKPEVDDIRGVDSGQVIKGLLERSLLKMLGKKDEPGRPTLYGTTTDFLELLNLQSLKDLPTLREYTELSEESQRKFLEETGEAAPSDTTSFERAGAESAEGSVSGTPATGETPEASPVALSSSEDGLNSSEEGVNSDAVSDGDDEGAVATAVDGGSNAERLFNGEADDEELDVKARQSDEREGGGVRDGADLDDGVASQEDVRDEEDAGEALPSDEDEDEDEAIRGENLSSDDDVREADDDENDIDDEDIDEDDIDEDDEDAAEDEDDEDVDEDDEDVDEDDEDADEDDEDADEDDEDVDEDDEDAAEDEDDAIRGENLSSGDDVREADDENAVDDEDEEVVDDIDDEDENAVEDEDDDDEEDVDEIRGEDLSSDDDVREADDIARADEEDDDVVDDDDVEEIRDEDLLPDDTDDAAETRKHGVSVDDEDGDVRDEEK